MSDAQHPPIRNGTSDAPRPPSPQPTLTGNETEPRARSIRHRTPAAALASAAPAPCRGTAGALAGVWLSSVQDGVPQPGRGPRWERGGRSQLRCLPAQSRQGREAAVLRAATTRLSERVWSVKSNKASRRSPGSVAACRPRPHHAPEATHYGASRSPELHVCYDLTLRDMK